MAAPSFASLKPAWAGVRPAAVVLLIAVAAGGALPVLRQAEQAYLRFRAFADLRDAPVEAAREAIASGSVRFTARATAFQAGLREAEEWLWGFRQQREPALILKDVGDAEGGMGLSALAAAYEALAPELALLELSLATGLEEQRAFREERGAAWGARLDATLRRAAGLARRLEGRLRLYNALAKEVRGHLLAVRVLAPQVATAVAPTLQTLPESVRPLQTGMAELDAALRLVAALPPKARNRPGLAR